MWNKFKKILIKIPWKGLILCFILLSLIIFIDKFKLNLSFFNQFESETIANIRLYAKDLKILYKNVKPVFYAFFIIDILLMIFKIILKKDSIKIMIINTFENTKVNIFTNYIYENKDFLLDLSKDIKRLGTHVKGYTNIVKELDDYVESFMEKKEEQHYAFAGILHTPYILRLGYKVGDETYFKLFHKKRTEDTFKLLTSKEEYLGNYPTLNIESSLTNSDVLVVSIATTFPITKEQVADFDIEQNNYLKFETSDTGFDIISSEKQIDNYKNMIFENIRRIVREKNIKLIHLCISSSVAFTFAIGQGFSKQYDPNIIIYNYENQKYTWGIKLFEKAENSIVLPTKNLVN